MVLIGIAYLCVVQVGFLRSIMNGSRPVIAGFAEIAVVGLLVSFLWIGVRQAYRRGGPAGPVRALTVSLVLYVAMNVISSGLGLRNPGLEAKYLRELVSLWSPSGFRTIFPFALSGQMLSICAGSAAILVLGYSGKRWSRYSVRVITWVLVAAVLLGHGGRGPTFAMVLTMMALWLTKNTRTLGKVLSIAALVGAILLPVIALSTSVLALTEQRVGKVAAVVSRQAGDIATLSNRDLIWITAARGMVALPLQWWVVGSGARGQVSSGLSRQWAFLFEYSYAEAEVTNAHNSYLQVTLDYGLAGFVLFLGAFIALVWKASSVNSVSERSGNVVVWAVIYLAVTGALEASLTYFALDTWLLLIALYLTVAIYAEPGSRGSGGDRGPEAMRAGVAS